jgi:hypothetical protein
MAAAVGVVLVEKVVAASVVEKTVGIVAPSPPAGEVEKVPDPLVIHLLIFDELIGRCDPVKEIFADIIAFSEDGDIPALQALDVGIHPEIGLPLCQLYGELPYRLAVLLQRDHYLIRSCLHRKIQVSMAYRDFSRGFHEESSACLLCTSARWLLADSMEWIHSAYNSVILFSRCTAVLDEGIRKLMLLYGVYSAG